MGRTSDEEGESSTTYKSDLEERPLKKARYVWQIKGKYHLKKNDNAQTSNSESTNSLVDLRPLNSNFKNDKNTNIQDVNNSRKIDFEVKSFDSGVNESIKDGVITEKYDSKIFRNDRLTRCVSETNLRKWQARQVARCYVDNTINTVLEEMGFHPMNGEHDMLDEDLQIPENSSDENLEDEAVMMAIHSHGLQRLVARNQELTQSSRNKSTNSPANENHLVSCSCSLSPRVTVMDGFHNFDPFHKRSVILQRLDYERENHSEEHHKIYLDSFSDSSSCDSNSIVDTHKPIRSPLAEINKSEIKYDSEDKEEKSCSSFEHNDFMDKAVAVAISKKGLSALSCMEF